jgi:hypothetical protein
MVRAKFRCNKNEGGTVEMTAVVEGSEENRSFFSATPNGQLTLHIVREETASHFEVGKEYYLDLTPAEG